MKSIVISIRPKWVAKILNGEKSIEIRKSKPKEQVEWVYIYCTKPDIRSKYRIGHLGFSNDEVYRLPNGLIKYGDSVELMAYDNNDYNNFFNGKIVARFKIGNIDKIPTALAYNESIDEIEINSNLTLADIMRYAEGKNVYGWHIQKLEIFDKLKELSEFGLKKAPQSWCYVKGENKMRLTKAVSGRGGKYLVDLLDIQVVADKLGLLEDIEEDFGIDLVKLLSAKSIFVVEKSVFYDFKISVIEQCVYVSVDDCDDTKLSFDDYGKTWALDKSDLVNDIVKKE